MAKIKIVPVSLPKELASALDKEAKRESMTRSELVRDTLRRRLAFSRLNDFQQEFSRRAKKAGLRTQAGFSVCLTFGSTGADLSGLG